VSWFEATAYCRWLSEQRGEAVRLPAEAEWEAAATPAEGEHPWGKAEPAVEKANFGEKIGRPTPVGIYPAGDGRFGHCDLAGNVWEWCADEIRGGRALRGGGWEYSAVYLRSAIRLRVRAEYRTDYFGFRVAAARASTLNP